MNKNFIPESTPVLLNIARDENLAPGITCGPLIRSIYVFECCTAGYGSVIINGREFSVSPGDFYILLPGDTVTHTASLTEPRSGLWAFVDGFSIGRILSDCGINSANPYAPRELFPVIKSHMESLYEMREDNDPGAEFRRTAFLYSIIGEITRHSTSGDKNIPIRKAIGIIEENYNTKLDVSDIANSVGLARNYFSQLFKEVTGISPHAYLTKLRIQRFCTLVKNEDISISLAAECVGLDPQNFSRIFKRETGKTPLEYTKEHMR